MSNLIFGRTFEEIEAMQQGQGGRTVDYVITPPKDASQLDRDLLEQHGLHGLIELGYHGVIERLRFSGVIDG